MGADSLENYMQRAIGVAQNGRFRACPNPATGAVLVKDGQIVAEGWHKKAGEAHAEIACLNDAAMRGINPEGALMVVTLEPCKHQGRTPPCVDALLKAKISALAYGTADPNPLAQGGAAKLKANGVRVFGPVLERECKDLVADFTIWQTTSRPYLILKMASSLDGRIATRTGDARWISCAESRGEVHALRDRIGHAGGIVLVGGETFRLDNPGLDCRMEPCERQPLAGIVTTRLPDSSDDFRLFQRAAETVFFTTMTAAKTPQAAALRKIGCRIAEVPLMEGKADLNALLKYIRTELSCYYVLCEGGGRLALSLLEARLVDEFHLYLAPIIMGDTGAKALFDGHIIKSVSEALQMRFCAIKQSGKDLKLILRPDSQETGTPCSPA